MFTKMTRLFVASILVVALASTIAASAAIAPSVAQGSQHKPAPFVLLHGARCLPVGQWDWKDTYIAKAGEIVTLSIPWVMTGDKYADDFLSNTTRTSTINGQRIFNEADYWAVEVVELTTLHPQQPQANRVLYWTYPPLGPLQSGTSIVFEWGYSAEKTFTDGIATIEQGSEVSHTCTVVWKGN